MQLFVISHKKSSVYDHESFKKEEANLFAAVLVINLKHMHGFRVGLHYHHCDKGKRMGYSCLAIP